MDEFQYRSVVNMVRCGGGWTDDDGVSRSDLKFLCCTRSYLFSFYIYSSSSCSVHIYSL